MNGTSEQIRQLIRIHGEPVEVFVLVARSRDDTVSNFIALTTIPFTWIFRGRLKDVPSHIALGFKFADGYEVYFESLFVSGWKGPKPISNIVVWVTVNPGRRWARKFYIRLHKNNSLNIELHTSAVQRKFHKSIDRVGEWVYGKKQFPYMFMWSRFTLIRVGAALLRLVPNDTPNAVVCSEAVGRVLEPEIDMRVFFWFMLSFEQLSPVFVMIVVQKLAYRVEDICSSQCSLHRS